MKEGGEAYCHFKRHKFFPKDFNYAMQEISSPSEYISAYFEIEGPSYTISTACSSSAKALAAAKRLIDGNICDAVICGGADTICDLIRNGFDSLELLSTNRTIPFSINRKGITLGTGGALFIAARDDLFKSNPPFLNGYGETSDAFHISGPEPTGIQPEKAIQKALDMANITPSQISYINLHGTGSILNDNMEATCIKRTFNNTFISSTKALTGHTLGGCGALEAAFLWLLQTNMTHKTCLLPPHVFDNCPEDPSLNFVKKGDTILIEEDYINMLSNSFAFGGSNVSLIISRKIS